MIQTDIPITTAYIHLDRLTHNMHRLKKLAKGRPLWPAIKANAYGHGLVIVARHLVQTGYNTLCVAHVSEVMELAGAGLSANYVLLSATLPEHSEAIVRFGCEPVVCTLELVQSLDMEAKRQGRPVSIHVKVDTGMGRVGIRPDEVTDFLSACRNYSNVKVKGLMSHFPCADMADKSLSYDEIKIFRHVVAATQKFNIEVRHMANSAALLDLPDALFDAVRPGIAIYGLRPSWEINNAQVDSLKPVLEWRTRITFLKEVEEGTGLSYGHTFHTRKPSLIATLPVGYGDGLARALSNQLEVLVHGVRCPQVGRITMDQSLVDVTGLRGRVKIGDVVMLIGEQKKEKITADELALKLDTINYEIVTNISRRVPRVAQAG